MRWMTSIWNSGIQRSGAGTFTWRTLQTSPHMIALACSGSECMWVNSEHLTWQRRLVLSKSIPRDSTLELHSLIAFVSPKRWSICNFCLLFVRTSLGTVHWPSPQSAVTSRWWRPPFFRQNISCSSVCPDPMVIRWSCWKLPGHERDLGFQGRGWATTSWRGGISTARSQPYHKPMITQYMAISFQFISWLLTSVGTIDCTLVNGRLQKTDLQNTHKKP